MEAHEGRGETPLSPLFLMLTPRDASSSTSRRLESTLQALLRSSQAKPTALFAAASAAHLAMSLATAQSGGPEEGPNGNSTGSLWWLG
eukprot:7456517-Pyramimonas_sp.AAC.1